MYAILTNTARMHRCMYGFIFMHVLIIVLNDCV